MTDVMKVGIGKPQVKGSIYAYPATAAYPTTAAEELDEEVASEVGYISEDGVANAFNDSHTDIKAWGGDIVASPLNESSETFNFTMIETNEASMIEYFGKDNVTHNELGELVVASSAYDKPAHPWVIDTVLNEYTLERIVIPRGKVTELGELSYNDGAVLGYPITIKALPDKFGKRAYRYIAVADADVPEIEVAPQVDEATFILSAEQAKEVTGDPSCAPQTFYVHFDKPLGDCDYMIEVEIAGKKYGLGVEGKKNPEWTKAYFTLSDGRQVDFVDGVPKTTNASAKVDLSSPSGTAVLTVYQLEGDFDPKTYPTDKTQIFTETIALA